MIDIIMAEMVNQLRGIEKVSLLADATPRKKHAFLHNRYAEDAVTRVVG